MAFMLFFHGSQSPSSRLIVYTCTIPGLLLVHRNLKFDSGGNPTPQKRREGTTYRHFPPWLLGGSGMMFLVTGTLEIGKSCREDCKDLSVWTYTGEHLTTIRLWKTPKSSYRRKGNRTSGNPQFTPISYDPVESSRVWFHLSF